MYSVKSNSLNPNPIPKFFVTVLLGFTILHSINHYSEWALIIVISIMYFINGFRKEGIQNIIVFGILFFVPDFTILAKFPLVIKMLLSLLFVVRMFYIPYASGKFLIKTSDVGSIMSSMDFLRIPKAVSIPIAVMFRFFPSFEEEYIAVPLLIISSNIADDIAKAAETKCIANPIKKTRYITVRVHIIDFIYAFIMTVIVVGGRLCLH